MNATLTKCPCNVCNANIEFETEHAGQTVTCPHCGVETILFLPPVSRLPTSNGSRSSIQSPPLPSRMSRSTKRLLWRIAGIILAIAALFFIIRKIALSTAATEAVFTAIPGVLGVVVILAAAIWAMLWVLFPVFVYFALQAIKAKLDRGNELLESIRAKI